MPLCDGGKATYLNKAYICVSKSDLMFKILIRINLMMKYISVFGMAKGLAAFLQTQSGKGEAVFSVGASKHPIHLRRSTSDIDVFNQVFLVQEYKWPMPQTPGFIVDCGANIGLTSIYFARNYPHAQIIAVEPEETNFEVLKRNARGYTTIECVQSGIWNKDTFLKVEDPSAEKWEFTFRETDQAAGATPALCIGTILKRYNRKEIDILKIDIEGSEREVFSSNFEDWLPHTKTIMIELHDNMKKGCSRAFFSALLKYDFSFDVRGRGKTLICTRN